MNEQVKRENFKDVKRLRILSRTLAGMGIFLGLGLLTAGIMKKDNSLKILGGVGAATSTVLIVKINKEIKDIENLCCK